MNDRFKFRIYDLEQKHYLRVIQDETTGAEGFAAFYGEYNNICKPMSFFLCHNIDRWVIEQCTGLKDNCGNLIYEGDVVKDKFDNTYLIKWFNAKFICEDQAEMQPIFSPSQELLLNWGVKIIGNIHEQAEQKDVK